MVSLALMEVLLFVVGVFLNSRVFTHQRRLQKRPSLSYQIKHLKFPSSDFLTARRHSHTHQTYFVCCAGCSQRRAFNPLIKIISRLSSQSSLPTTIKMTTPSTSGRPSKDRLKLFYNTHMVTIEVGIEKEHFVVHQSFLCAKSQYFSKALSGSFQESITRFVRLPDVSPIIFKIFVAWVYHDTLSYVPSDKKTIGEEFESLQITEKDLEHKPILENEPLNKSNENKESDIEDSDDNMTGPSTPAAMPENSNHDTSSTPASTRESTSLRSHQFQEEDPTTWGCDVLIRLYVFADRFDICQLRTASLDALIDGSGVIWEPIYVRYIYQNTPAKSKLREYTVHSTAYEGNLARTDVLEWEACPQEFLVAVMFINSRRLPADQCRKCYKRALSYWDSKDSMRGEFSMKKDLPPYERDRCYYHEHLSEEEREACRIGREERKDSELR